MIHFSEINSSGSSGEGSSGQGSRIPIKIKFKKIDSPVSPSRSRSPSTSLLDRHYLSYPQVPIWHPPNQFVFNVDQKSSPESDSHGQSSSLSKVNKVVVTYMGKEIEMSYTRSRHKTIPLDCKILGPHVGVPTLEYRKHHGYVVNAIYINDLRCVVYTDPNKEVALGAKLPPTANTVLPKDDPRLLDPDNTKWYITLEGDDYEVMRDPVLGTQLDIKLVPRNKRPDAEYIRRNGVKTEAVLYGGLFFLRFRNHNNVTVGADLDYMWKKRPEYANIVSEIDAVILKYRSLLHEGQVGPQ